MSRISQEKASQVTDKLVEKLGKEIKAKEQELKEYVTEQYKAALPKEVVKMWERGKKWMNSTKQCYIDGVGIGNYETFYLSEELPKDCSSTKRLSLSPEQATHVLKLKNSIESLQIKKKTTYKEIYNTILSLGTWKRVLEHMPELRPYVPTENNNVGLMLVPSAIKEKIQCLISTTDNSCIEQL